MNPYGMEKDLCVPASSPHFPRPGPLAAEERFAANSLEAPTVGAVLGGMVRPRSPSDSTLELGIRQRWISARNRILLLRFRRKRYLIERISSQD